MKKLERKEMKNLMGGDAPVEDGGTCCSVVADCHVKSGKKAACNSHYVCANDNSKNKCMYTPAVQ